MAILITGGAGYIGSVTAWRLHEANALRDFDPYPMVLQAAGYLILHGPATPQERWEENSGYSPSTLASNIAALSCAASFVKERGDSHTAAFIQQYADFLECHIEPWTVTTQGTLLPDVSRHFIRIQPVAIDGNFMAERGGFCFVAHKWRLYDAPVGIAQRGFDFEG